MNHRNFYQSLNMQIVPAHNDNYDDISNVLMESYKDYLYQPKEPDSQSHHYMNQLINTKERAEYSHVAGLMIENNGVMETVGTITIVCDNMTPYSIIGKKGCAELRFNAIIPEHQGKGLSKILIEYARDIAYKNKSSHWLCSTMPDMLLAQKLYCSHGMNHDESLDHIGIDGRICKGFIGEISQWEHFHDTIVDTNNNVNVDEVIARVSAVS